MTDDGLKSYYDAMNGIREDGCTCILHKGPEYHAYNGPQPAEWEQNPDCPLHGEYTEG